MWVDSFICAGLLGYFCDYFLHCMSKSEFDSYNFEANVSQVTNELLTYGTRSFVNNNGCTMAFGSTALTQFAPQENVYYARETTGINFKFSG